MINVAAFEDWFGDYISERWLWSDAYNERLQRFQRAMMLEFCDYHYGLTETFQNHAEN